MKMRRERIYKNAFFGPLKACYGHKGLCTRWGRSQGFRKYTELILDQTRRKRVLTNWCWYEKHWTELYKVQKVQFKFIELRGPFKFSSLDKNWIAAQLTNELFLTDKVSSERVECTYFIKGRNYRIMCVMKRKKAQFLLFSTRGHSSLSKLTLFILSSKKFNGELRGSSSSSSNELSLNRPLSSRKNWI